MRMTSVLWRLALADLWHDRKVSLCVGASMVAVIAPLLLLFGLKHGVVSQLQDELVQDPRNLEIRMLSSGSFDDDWIAGLAANPDIGFVIGQTRSLNAQADLLNPPKRFSENAEIIPTGAKDPLLAGLDAEGLDEGGVMLSARAAQQLGAQTGDVITMRVARRLAGHEERGSRPLTVRGILAPSAYPREAAFVVPVVLHDMERFRDGYAIPALGLDTGEPLATQVLRYARARIFAKTIDGVEPIERSLNDARIETSSRLRDIQNIRAINHVLGLIFGVIAVTATLGCMASLAGAFLANVDRKRRDIAVLRLLGFTSRAVSTYILYQALVLAVIAYLIGLALYGVGSEVFNRVLNGTQATGQFICRITWTHGAWAFALTLGVALIVSLMGALRAIHVQPAESLRDI